MRMVFYLSHNGGLLSSRYTGTVGPCPPATATARAHRGRLSAAGRLPRAGAAGPPARGRPCQQLAREAASRRRQRASLSPPARGDGRPLASLARQSRAWAYALLARGVAAPERVLEAARVRLRQLAVVGRKVAHALDLASGLAVLERDQVTDEVEGEKELEVKALGGELAGERLAGAGKQADRGPPGMPGKWMSNG